MEKYNKNEEDVKLLDELVALCEQKMMSPFKKKAEVVVAKVEPKEGESEEGCDDCSDEKTPNEGEEQDLEALMELYTKLKDK